MKRAATALGLLVGLTTVACGDDSDGSGGAGGGAATSTTTVATTTGTTTATSTTATSSGQGGDTGAGGGTGGTGELHPGPGEACDPVEQDCADPAAPKCAAQPPLDTARVPATCEELLGELQIGESCSRPTDEGGIDDCDVGLYCSPVGEQLSSPQTRSCRKLCDAHDQCEPDESCSLFNITEDGSPLPADARLVGVCFGSCDPFDPDACGDAARCVLGRSIDFTYVLRCAPGDGTDALGEACTSNQECSPGSGCIGSVCRAWCDFDAGCEDGSSCLDVTDPFGPLVFHGPAYGFCPSGAAN